MLKVTFENGVTVIDTGDATGGIKNTKTGYHGVTFNGKVYMATIFVKKTHYHLGSFDNLEEAVAIRTEAEAHRADGTFFEWFPTLWGKTRRIDRNNYFGHANTSAKRGKTK